MYLSRFACIFQIYKSTKCNDMVQTSFCPRGAFCAFAHVERKLAVYSRYWLFIVRRQIKMYCIHVLNTYCDLTLKRFILLLIFMNLQFTLDLL